MIDASSDDDYRIACADVNGDGYFDIIYGKSQNIYTNDGTADFDSSAGTEFGRAAADIAVGDGPDAGGAGGPRPDGALPVQVVMARRRPVAEAQHGGLAKDEEAWRCGSIS